MAESSSASAGASAAGSNILDLELAGTDSDSSFDDQETTDEWDTSQTTTSEASSSKVCFFNKHWMLNISVECACHCCQNELHHEFVVEFCSIMGYFASIKIEKK